jgi:phenylacetate-coenzyme A ligase PaaK-like adenylate-forming protein
MAATDQIKRLADLAAAMRLGRELIGHDRWTVEQLEAFRRRRLGELVRHATASSPFYRERYAGLDPGDPVELRRLPAVDKATVMERFDDLVCDRRLTLAAVEAHLDGLTRDELLEGRYRAMATGGSTGRKGVFVADRAEWRQYLAGFFRWNHYVGLVPRLPRRRRIASIAAARPLHMTFRMAASIDVGLYRVLRLEAATPLAEMVEALNRYQPEFLYAYGSVLGLLAAEQLDGRLRIGPTVIASSGETHTDELRDAIRAAWGTSSFELYAMTEAGILGSHCDHHSGIHLFEDQAIVEVVDEQGRPVPDGQVGHKLLVTNLVLRTQPLIRYEVSDMVAVAGERCPCGRPFRLLRAIEGRNDDILYLPAAAGGTAAVHPLALRTALAGIPWLARSSTATACTSGLPCAPTPTPPRRSGW